MGIMLLKWTKVWNVDEGKDMSCGCKRAREGKSYSSVRTQLPESECTQWTSQAYKRKDREKGLSLLTRAHTGWWRLQENKTKDKYATRLTIYTKK